MKKAWRITSHTVQALPVPEDASLDDLSHAWPQGFYTTFRTVDGARKVVGLSLHLARLYEPARASGVPIARAEGELRRVLDALLAAWRPGEARVRLHLATDGTFYLAIESFRPPPERLYEQGVSAVTVPFRRESPRLKRSDYVEARRSALERVRQAGAYEGLITHNGRIWEGLSSNFFYVRDGVLGTAKHNVLPGVTRAVLLRLARRLGIPRRYRALPVADLPFIAEAFLCSSSRGPVPIVRVDDVPVGEGVPGPLTRRLLTAYRQEIRRIGESILGG